MKISQTLPQFENHPTLFVVSGEFEANFFLAQNGTIEKYPALEMNPRQEAMEKQVFINKSGGAGTGAVSHQERYMEDLKTRFQKGLAEAITAITDAKNIAEICIIAPRYAANSLKKALKNSDSGLVHLTIYGLHTKKDAREILDLYQKELTAVNHYIVQSHADHDYKNREHVILQ